MKKRRAFPWVWLVILAVGTFISLWPLLRHGFYASDDGEWMVIRLSAFYQSLAEGQFPVRLLGRLNNNYGYPVANFLYPGFLYIGSLLHFFRLSYVVSIKVIMGGAVIGATLFMFAALKRRFPLGPSVVGAIGFVMSPYLLFDLWHRGSVGEVLAFFPAAMIFFAMTSDTLWLLPGAVALLIVSHNSFALIFGLAFAVIAFFSGKVKRLFGGTIVGIGMATFFWLPALFERAFVLFETTTVSNPRSYFVVGSQTLLLGFPVILALLASLGFRKKYNKEYWSIVVVLLFGYFFALPISGVVWGMPLLGTLVQFPYRFLSLIVLFGPWMIASTATLLHGWRLGVFIVLCSLLWLHGAWVIERPIVFVDHPEGFYATNEGTTTVADEYMPIWVKQKAIHRPVTPIEVLSGNALVTPIRIGSEAMLLTINAHETSVIQINKIFYPGWGITIDTLLVPIEHENLSGVMRVTVPQGVHEVAISFRETLSRFAADLISLVFGIIYLVYWKKLSHVS